ncbi:pyridoxal phosphate-dependent aminotransferase [Geochorda subterranea]|uniref:Aminotransferase n=1 Tax=Geochorda subterranea TaxID=3109564 RepID=A0ABZ1BT17_9FIRM|nr:pyridoxal phosphate-dependent aminotransferase [Limnochorda sp. LNt]WRP15292.1 pyridoxal phosphate-dependent aminotransferase [Limnochorda sp. LNt]
MESPVPSLSRRSREIPAFLAMDVLDRARALERQGRRIIHLEVGDPDFPTPPPIVEAGRRALAEGHTHYTESMGIRPLREAIARHYHRRYGVDVSPERVLVTSGTSPALAMVMQAILDPGDEALVPDPGYACYANFVRAAGGVPVAVDAGPASGYRLTVEALEAARTPRTRAVLVNSPSNPTGVVYGPEALQPLVEWAERHGIWLISDEIYHGLSETGPEPSALEYGPRAVVVDGCSKRYAMTGWRLGWCVAPVELVRPLQKLQQNLMVCAPAASQAAAVAALTEGEPYVAAMARAYAERRRILTRGLEALGLPVAGRPQGAFYVLADVRRITSDSVGLAFELLERTGVALTPGVDFGQRGEGHLRLSCAASPQAIQEGLRLLGEWLRQRGERPAAG